MSSSGHGAEHPFPTPLQPVHIRQLRSGKRNGSQEQPCVTRVGLCQAANPRGQKTLQVSISLGISPSVQTPPGTFSSPFAFPLVADVLFPLRFYATTARSRCDSRWAPGIAPSAKCIAHCKGSMQDWDALKRNSDGSYISTARTDGTTCQGAGRCSVPAAAVTLPAGSGVTGRWVAVHVHASCCMLLTAGSHCKSGSRSRRSSPSNLEGGWFGEIGIKIRAGGWEGKRRVISPRRWGESWEGGSTTAVTAPACGFSR